MNRAKIQEKIMQFSRELDRKTLDDFMERMHNRLALKRQAGRTGWELMTEVELADLMCKVMNKAQGKGENFYLDLANLLMFAHALEVDPQDIMVVLEEHLGRNWQCRQEVLDKYDTPQSEIDNAKIEPNKPNIMDAVNQIPDGATCEIYGVGEDPKQAIWSAQEQEFIVSCEGGGAIGYHPRGISGYHIIAEPKTGEEEALAKAVQEAEVAPLTEPEPVEPDPLVSGHVYVISVDGASCFNYYKYREATNCFKECDICGRLVKGGRTYNLKDLSVVLTWERVKEYD